MRRPRLVYVVTHPVTADLLLRGQLGYMQRLGFDVTVVASPGPELGAVAHREGARTVALSMTRSISPAADLVATARLTLIFRQLRPDIVHASTPKAGLLGMLAARAARVPVRVYLLRGLRLETTRGPLRTVLGATERLAASCAHVVPCVSQSLLRAAVEGGYVPADKACVVGSGSSNGVDASRFARTPDRAGQGRQVLASLGLDPDRPVITFVGRLVRDKGVVELLAAFRELTARRPDAQLLLVGADIGGEAVDDTLRGEARRTPGVFLTGTMTDLAPVYAATTVLAFPSFREGFPNVVLEAAASGVPAVGFDVTGTVDGIRDGHTGAIVPRGDVHALGRALLRYVEEPALRAEHGDAARRRVEAGLDAPRVWDAWLRFYDARLVGAGLPGRRPAPVDATRDLPADGGSAIHPRAGEEDR